MDEVADLLDRELGLDAAAPLAGANRDPGRGKERPPDVPDSPGGVAEHEQGLGRDAENHAEDLGRAESAGPRRLAHEDDGVRDDVQRPDRLGRVEPEVGQFEIVAGFVLVGRAARAGAEEAGVEAKTQEGQHEGAELTEEEEDDL